MATQIYAAGNFVLMSDPKKEKRFIEEVTKRTGECNRLISFFFKKELQTVLEVNKDHKYRYELLVDGNHIFSADTEEEIWDAIDNNPGEWLVRDGINGKLIKNFVPF